MDGQVDLAKLEVPDGVKLTAEGKGGFFIWEVGSERKYGKEFMRSLKGQEKGVRRWVLGVGC